MERRLIFSFQLPLSRREAAHIEIRSRPSGFLPPDAGDRLRDELAPVKFKLLNAWVM
jgi:hypothetical protein